MKDKQACWVKTDRLGNVEWVGRMLLKRGNFWSIKPTALGSWMWRKLLKFCDKAKQFCKIEVHNRLSTSFWFDDWSRMGRLVEVAGDRGFIDMGITKHMTVAEAWARPQQRRHRQSVLTAMETELDFVWDTSTSRQDVVLWKGSNGQYKSQFSTKDTWSQLQSSVTEVSWHKSVWFPHSLPKFSFCMWLAVRNRLSTGDRLMQWNRGAQGTCIFCSQAIETRDHLFFSCRFSAEVWKVSTHKVYQTRFSTNWNSVISSACHKWGDRTHRFLACSVLQTTVYSLWQERNRRMHGEPPQPTSCLIRAIDRHMRDQLLAIELLGDRRYDTGLQAWFTTRPHSL